MNRPRLSAVAVCSYWLGRQGHPMVKRLKANNRLLRGNWNHVRHQRDELADQVRELKDELWRRDENEAIARAMAYHPAGGRQPDPKSLAPFRLN